MMDVLSVAATSLGLIVLPCVRSSPFQCSVAKQSSADMCSQAGAWEHDGPLVTCLVLNVDLCATGSASVSSTSRHWQSQWHTFIQEWPLADFASVIGRPHEMLQF